MTSVISGDANVSATEFGYLDGVTSALQTQIDGKLNLAGGKILQIVRATDATQRTTTSETPVDANISVTITPQKSDSAIILFWSHRIEAAGSAASFIGALSVITDSSNNFVSGSEGVLFTRNYTTSGTPEIRASRIVIGYATPATTSPVTYKGRFYSGLGGGTITVKLVNDGGTIGQLYAIEVSA